MDENIENINHAYMTLKKLHISANNTNTELINEINALKEENQYLRELNSNADKNVSIQKEIVRNSLQSSQEKHERDYREIMELKNEILRLKNEIKLLNDK